MPKVTDFSTITCSIARSFNILGDSWVPLILRDVYCGICRFDELRADLGVARAVLTTRLARLVDAHVLERQRYSCTHQRDEYRLTEMGNDLVPVLMAAMAWGDRWLDGGDGAPMRLRHQPCGHTMTPTISCSACSEPLVAEQVTPEPGPGGRNGFGTRLIGTRVVERL